ncbi:winged helix-turn-helix transcriptional regulator [Cryobacterium sinapicolor]|uniref:Winged helix-turn-helix transcriptional regulator n=1 Tax=Cryobacterium sinapicolor TaxID=1259236 RepID=A0ABY2JKK4_9MICO|nr:MULTISPECIES: winged helix-turn-helix transcriptional regulator [Cryobacterium]TFC88212.1 winged helix-turn-helix transcriptional regulator [Cryobacterium sp. TMT3-29-2]TFD05266.1 winged helix-turn-helix transcriptional regulator [Cryobacterium sinapicolor]
MFVITADQIGSRNDRDRAGEMIAELVAAFGPAFTLPPDQTAGDEIQLLLPDAGTSLAAVLALHRSGHWSIGLGIGDLRTPLAETTRQASGGAFVAARAAVTRAKKAEARFSLESDPAIDRAVADPAGDGDRPAAPASGRAAPLLDTDAVEALITTLLLLRQRRSPEGWAAIDLLVSGMSQVEIAAELGISPAAVSQRIRNALWRVDQSAQPALVRLLENLEHAATETDPST